MSSARPTSSPAAPGRLTTASPKCGGTASKISPLPSPRPNASVGFLRFEGQVQEIYDVQLLGYPQRMRDHDARERILRRRER